MLATTAACSPALAQALMTVNNHTVWRDIVTHKNMVNYVMVGYMQSLLIVGKSKCGPT